MYNYKSITMNNKKFKYITDLQEELNYNLKRNYNNRYSVPKFYTGGEVNYKYSYPIFPNGLEEMGLSEVQTEKGEVGFLPDKTVVDVKAKKLHKDQDKNNITDILPQNTYIFSRDPKMKFKATDKIKGIAIEDMTLGKSVYKYDENENTKGPEDIKLKDYFFNGNTKKAFTSSEIAQNIKKNFPMVDMKEDLYANRAIEENASQREVYLSILKAFNEFKRPKTKDEKAEERQAKRALQEMMMQQQMMQQQQLQNGIDPNSQENPVNEEMVEDEINNEIPLEEQDITEDNVNDRPLENMEPMAQYGKFIQPTQQGFEGNYGFSRASLDPYKKMDNNFKKMFNLKSPNNINIPNPYKNLATPSFKFGGEIPTFQGGGDLFDTLGLGLDSLFGWSRRAGQRQEAKNRDILKQLEGYQSDYQKGVDQSGMYNMLGAGASYMAGLNVPDQRYDTYNEQESLLNAYINRAKQNNEASKYTLSQGIGSASSLARYNDAKNYGNYLAQVQSQNDTNMTKLNQAMNAIDQYRYEQAANYATMRNQARNTALNTKANQLYNTNVQGMANIGKAASDSTINSATAKYLLGTEKMAYERYLENLVKQAKDETLSKVQTVTKGIGQAAGALAGAGVFGTGAGGMMTSKVFDGLLGTP